MRKNPGLSVTLGSLIITSLVFLPATAAELVNVEPTQSGAGGEPLQFSDLGGVKSWKSGGDAVVFVRSKDDQWYKADLAETCMKLDTKKGINFLTETEPETYSKVSKVVVDRHICTVTSLTKVDAPTTTTN
jgi:hypothetical protein